MPMFQRQYQIAPALKEVLGAQQSLGSLICIALMTFMAALFWLNNADFSTTDTALWRHILATTLMLDIAAGAVANFTRGTNEFYAQRPAGRWLFIALHIHLPAIGWLLEQPLLPLLLIWGFTIGAAICVNMAYHQRWQPVIAGLFLCAGVVVVTEMNLPSWQTGLAMLFVIKVVYAFAVNHYPQHEVIES